MEVTTNYILEIEIRDKRHVGLSSTNMEKEALKNALSRLSAALNVVEVATDASSSIKKLIGKYIYTLYVLQVFQSLFSILYKSCVCDSQHRNVTPRDCSSQRFLWPVHTSSTAYNFLAHDAFLQVHECFYC